MFKKLDKLIIKAFVGPFIATFFITLLVLIMQFFWLWIDDFVGKGLGAGIVLKFIWFQSAVLVPLALPLAVLLSSLMTFGSLGESFELVAIKSSGISLLRFMRPLFLVAIVISGIAFLFSNYVIPVAFLKSRTLLSDIIYAKPAFDLKEGEFYDKIKGYAIKIGKKEKNDSIIRDVIVYEQGNILQDNFIIAKSGVMRISENKLFLEFDLRDGWRYEEKNPSSSGRSQGGEYIRVGFKEYRKQFDLRSFIFNPTNDSNANRNNERVYSMRQLNTAIDSLKKENDRFKQQLVKGIYKTNNFLRYLDTTGKNPPLPDSAWAKAKSVDDIIPDSAREAVYNRTVATINSMKSTLDVQQTNVKDQSKAFRKHKIEWHRKLVLSLACLVLFMIGAPLGSIIRKGGLGTPLIAAITFFMIFYFSNTTGEKMAKEDTLTPFAGMWMAVFILVPIGLFLTHKAMRDSQLFNKEWYHRTAKSVRKFLRKTKPVSS